MGADGGSVRQLTELRTSKLSHPIWSPDGSSIGISAGGGLTPAYTLLLDPNTPAREQVARTIDRKRAEEVCRISETALEIVASFDRRMPSRRSPVRCSTKS